MATTAGTIKTRYQITGTNRADVQISKTRYNDSLVVASGTNGDIFVRDSGQTDGWGWQTVLPVANGGTGLATLTAHALYVGNGTSAPTALAVGATGTVVIGNTGADPSFSANPTLTSLTLSGLTPTRVPFAGTAGLLGDVTGFTYVAGVLSLPTALALGAIPATSASGAAIRGALDFILAARNVANSADRLLIRYGDSGADRIRVGDAAIGLILDGATLSINAIPRFNGTNTTGAGTASLGTNCPAGTPGAPYTWVQVLVLDGSTCYMPAFK
jgi:hypothetical protein